MQNTKDKEYFGYLIIGLFLLSASVGCFYAPVHLYEQDQKTPDSIKYAKTEYVINNITISITNIPSSSYLYKVKIANVTPGFYKVKIDSVEKEFVVKDGENSSSRNFDITRQYVKVVVKQLVFVENNGYEEQTIISSVLLKPANFESSTEAGFVIFCLGTLLLSLGLFCSRFFLSDLRDLIVRSKDRMFSIRIRKTWVCVCCELTSSEKALFCQYCGQKRSDRYGED